MGLSLFQILKTRYLWLVLTGKKHSVVCTLILTAEYSFGLLFTFFHCYFYFIQYFSKFCLEFENLRKFYLKRLTTKINRTTNFKILNRVLECCTGSKEGSWNFSSLFRNLSHIYKLTRFLTKNLIFFNLQAILITMNRLNNYFAYKDLVPETLHSIHAYKTLRGIHTLSCLCTSGRCFT